MSCNIPVAGPAPASASLETPATVLEARERRSGPLRPLLCWSRFSRAEDLRAAGGPGPTDRPGGSAQGRPRRRRPPTSWRSGRRGDWRLAGYKWWIWTIAASKCDALNRSAAAIANFCSQAEPRLVLAGSKYTRGGAAVITSGALSLFGTLPARLPRPSRPFLGF